MLRNPFTGMDPTHHIDIQCKQLTNPVIAEGPQLYRRSSRQPACGWCSFS